MVHGKCSMKCGFRDVGGGSEGAAETRDEVPQLVHLEGASLLLVSRQVLSKSSSLGCWALRKTLITTLVISLTLLFWRAINW